MATTYGKIASVTVGSGGASSMSFTSIPATFDDLILQVSGRNSTTSNIIQLRMQFNSSGGTAYSDRFLYGSGSAAGSSSRSSQAYFQITTLQSTTSSTFGSATIYIPNYAGSTNKTISADAVTEANQTEAYQELYAGLWSNTAAISSIVLDIAGQTFVQYSTATLYGIKKS